MRPEHDQRIQQENLTMQLSLVVVIQIGVVIQMGVVIPLVIQVGIQVVVTPGFQPSPFVSPRYVLHYSCVVRLPL